MSPRLFPLLAFSVWSLVVSSAALASPLVIHPAVDELIAQGQEELCLWVFFSDKGAAEQNLDAALTEARSRLSERSLNRRARRAPGLNSLVGYPDIPVDRAYQRAVEAIGAQVRQHSRWLNAVSVNVDADLVESLALLPFVSELRPVAFHQWSEEERQQRLAAPQPADVLLADDPHIHQAPLNGSGIDYGHAEEQLEQMDMLRLHDLGYSGEGVLVAVFDTGFRKSHEALEDVTLVAERDFVFGDGNTEDEPEDEPGAMSHGTACWSIIGGWEPGTMVGGAFGADFAVAKTEDVRSETRAEEDNWVAAVEWADSLGVDVISSSLAYLGFDGGFSYSYSELDGRTAVTSLAAVQAHRYGIVVCNAMANSGPSPRTLHTPADADSILSVGAVEPDNRIADFSSRGPAADGRIKPDVCGRGTEIFAAYWESPNDYTPWFGGTSGATPFVAAAAALVLDVHPDWNVYDVIRALKSTASQAATPDNDYGWGVISAFDAAITEGVELGVTPKAGLEGASVELQSIAPNPFNPTTRIEFRLESAQRVRLGVYDASGRLVANLAGGDYAAGTHSVVWRGRNERGGSVPSGVYTIALETRQGRATKQAVVLK